MLNKVMVMGRLGKDPELKYTSGGSAVCSFSIACSENWKDKQGQKQERTEWINIEAWGKLAEISSQYLKKGSQALIEGKIKTDVSEYDGVKKYYTKVSATNVIFIGSRQDGDNVKRQEAVDSDNNFSSDDIPF